MIQKIKIYIGSGCRFGLKHSQNLTQKGNVFTLMERGMLNKIKVYISSGCRFGLKHLQNLTQKSNVLHINGKGYAKENKDLYEFGLQGWPSQ